MMQVSDRSPDDFLDELPEQHRDDMKTLDAIIASIFADDSRVMWEGVFWGGSQQSIIGYGDLVQLRSNGASVEWFVIGLALQKAGISVYVNAVKDGQYLGKVYGRRLGKVKIGSASIGFRKLENLDLDVFTAMIREARQLTR